MYVSGRSYFLGRSHTKPASAFYIFILAYRLVDDHAKH